MLVEIRKRSTNLKRMNESKASSPVAQTKIVRDASFCVSAIHFARRDSAVRAVLAPQLARVLSISEQGLEEFRRKFDSLMNIEDLST